MRSAEEILAQLAAGHQLRQLRTMQTDGKYVIVDGRRYLNFSGNDYLGLATETEFQRKFRAEQEGKRHFMMSNSSSRLITGNSPEYDALEDSLAALYPGKKALVLGSGYMVNIGVLPALTERGDLVLADKLVHASLVDGIKYCNCEWHRFRHNDMEHLEKLIRENRSRYRDLWVATESVFSMDGDRAPLQQLAELKDKYGVKLYIDEAHSFGVYGHDGAGLAASLGLADRMDIIVGTFGKALASTGAFVALGTQHKQLLVNRMRTLIFSTALPPLNLAWTNALVQILPSFDARREHLQKLVAALRPDDPGATHIVPFMAPGNDKVERLAARLRDEGFWVTPIRHPTVPRGQERMRISLSAALSRDDVERFGKLWKSIG